MIVELRGTKVFVVDKTLGYQGDNLVNTIQVTVDKDSIWNYKLDMYKGKSKCFDSVLMTREGNACTVQLTNEILSYGGRYIFQLRGYTDTQTYHSDIFESWVNASIEYQDDCKQADCGCDCKLPTEFYQVEDNVTEINNHPPYPGDNGKWMIWDVDKHEYVESDIEVIGGGGDAYQTKANLTTSITQASTDEQYPSAKAVYNYVQNSKDVMWVRLTQGTETGKITADKTNAEIYESYSNGVMIYGIFLDTNINTEMIMPCIVATNTTAYFETITEAVIRMIIGQKDKWGYVTTQAQLVSNLTTTISSISADDEYPSAKATYDYGQSIKTDLSTSIADAKQAGTDAQANLDTHIANKENPHEVTKAQVGLGNVDNTSDADKPVSTAQATAIDEAKKIGSDAQSSLTTHIDNKENPHKVTKVQVGLGEVDNTSDADKPVSNAQATSIADAKKAGTDAQTNLTAHINDKENPHEVTKEQVGLGNVDNTSDESKPVSTLQATAIADAKKAGTDAQANLTAHINDKENPHEVTKAQVGLGNVDNTSDANKPISTVTQTALDKKLDKTAVVDVTADATKGQAADAKSVYDTIQALPTGGGDISLGITGATVGNGAIIKTVNTDGKPIAWESVALAKADGSNVRSENAERWRTNINTLVGTTIYAKTNDAGKILAYTNSACTEEADFTTVAGLVEEGNALIIYDKKAYNFVGWEAPEYNPTASKDVAIFTRTYIGKNSTEKIVCIVETARFNYFGYASGTITAPITITSQEIMLNIATEEWTFTLDDGSTVTKTVLVAGA